MQYLAPVYLKTPHRVRIIEAADGAVVFYVRPEKTKNWSFGYEWSPERPESAAGLPFSAGHSGFIAKDARNLRISDLAIRFPLLSPQHPFGTWPHLVLSNATGLIELYGNSDVRLIDVSIAFGTQGVPKLLSPAMIWLATPQRVKEFDTATAASLGDDEACFLLLSMISRLDRAKATQRVTDAMRLAVSQTIQQFNFLLARTDVVEREIQDFLESRTLLLDPSASDCIPRLGFGGEFYSDFVLRYGEEGYRLVEIEPAREPILGRNGLSLRAQRAVGQVRSWVDFLERNPGHPLNRLTSVSPHWVVIGKRSELTEYGAKLVDEINQMTPDVQVRGFDELLDPFKKWAEAKINSYGTKLKEEDAKRAARRKGIGESKDR